MHFSLAIMMVCSTLFPPSAGDKSKNHPLRQGSIALPVPKVPKMSVGAICFTSSGSNGGCWLVLVSPPPPPLFFYFKEKGSFFPCTIYAKKRFTRLTPKKQNFRRTKMRPRQKKKATYVKKKPRYAYFHNRATFSSCGRAKHVSSCMRNPQFPFPPVSPNNPALMGMYFCVACLKLSKW